MPRDWRLGCACVFAAGGMGLAGCTVQRAHTVPFDGQSGQNKGVVYSVPKTYLSISVQYAYTRDDLHPGPAIAHLQGSVKIAPLLVPDERSTFLVKTDSFLSNVLFLTSVNFKFANGTLESVDANAVDRTGQIIEELSTTAVNIAKAAAKGEPTAREKALLAAEQRVEAIYGAIAKLSAEPVEGDQRGRSNLDALQAELVAARKLVLDLRANLDPPLRTQLAPLTAMVDPDHPTRETDEYLEYEVKPPQLFPEVPEDNMDVLYVRVYDNGRRGLVDALHEGRRPPDTDGIIYRQPVPLMTKVLAGTDEDDTTEVFSGILPYEQFSPPAVAVIDSKVLTGKKTTLVLDTVNGGVVTYGVAQDSAIVNAAQAAEAASKAAVDIQNADKPTPSGKGSTPGSSGRGGSGRGGAAGSSGSSSNGTSGASGRGGSSSGTGSSGATSGGGGAGSSTGGSSGRGSGSSGSTGGSGTSGGRGSGGSTSNPGAPE